MPGYAAVNEAFRWAKENPSLLERMYAERKIALEKLKTLQYASQTEVKLIKTPQLKVEETFWL